MKTKDGLFIRYDLRHTGYRLFNRSPRRVTVSQRGAILPLVAIGMGALLAMAGLALDMGHGYLNKTRLQNALDAAALSGAKTLDETTDTAKATTAAQTAFTMNANAAGNAELLNIAIGNVTVEFSASLNPFAPGGANPRFVRVGVGAADFARPSWLLQTVGIANIPVGARAVAGPSPELICPEILPVAPCGTGGPETNYGYEAGQEVQLKFDASNKGPIGNGNFGNVDVGCGPGGSCIRDSMAGAYEGCAKLGDTIPTKPGNNVGPNAQGLNTRFNCPPPGCGGVDTSEYKPDVIIDAGGPGYPDTYSQYMTDRDPFNPNWDLSPPTAQSDPPRRLVAVPVVNCSTAVNGSGDLPLLGVACMFLTRPTEHTGNTQTIFAEFRSSGCIGYGSAPGSNPVIGPGPHTIILYKDFGAADS